MQNPTLRDIAATLKLSHVTVSLALRNHPRISPKTCQRVQKKAREMGYRKNPMVQTLMTQVRQGKTQPITSELALLSDLGDKHGWKYRPNDNAAIKNAQKVAQTLGYRLEEFWLREPGMSFRRLREILIARRIQGILVGPNGDDLLELDMDLSPFSVVCLGQSVSNLQLHRVSHHHHDAMKLALKHLTESGYERIGFTVDIKMDARIESAWSSAFALYQSTLKRPQKKVPVFRKQHLGTKAILEWLNKHQVDVLITHGTELYRKLKANNIKIPQQLGFVDLNSPPHQKEITGIHQNNHIVGKLAIETLTNLIHLNQRGIPEHPQYSYIQGEWVVGKTIKKKRRHQ